MLTEMASRIKMRVCTLVSLFPIAAAALIGGLPWTRLDSTPAPARNDAASAARLRAAVRSARHPVRRGYPWRRATARLSDLAREPAPGASAHCEFGCA